MRDTTGSASDVRESPLAAPDRPEHCAGLGMVGKLRGKRELRGGDQWADRLGEFVLEERPEIFSVAPPRAHDRQSARHQFRVEGLCRPQARHRGDVPDVQRPDRHFDTPLMKRAAVGGERLHHRQVGTDQQQQDRLT